MKVSILDDYFDTLRALPCFGRSMDPRWDAVPADAVALTEPEPLSVSLGNSGKRSQRSLLGRFRDESPDRPLRPQFRRQTNAPTKIPRWDAGAGGAYLEVKHAWAPSTSVKFF